MATPEGRSTTTTVANTPYEPSPISSAAAATGSPAPLRLRRQAQPRLAAAPGHRRHRRHRGAAPAHQPAVEQRRRRHDHPDHQPAAAPALRPAAVRQHPPGRHRGPLRPVHPDATAVHRLPLPDQRRCAPGQGGARRRDHRTDGAAILGHRPRRHHRPRRRPGHHRHPHPRVPPGLPHRGARRRPAGDAAAHPAAHPQRGVPARGGEPLLPRHRDDPAHLRHPRPRPGAQRAAPHGPHPGQRTALRTAPGPAERPVRLTGLGLPQRPRCALPHRLGPHRLLRGVGPDGRRRGDAQRVPHHPHQLHHHPDGAGPGHHQGPGVGALGR